MLLSLHFTTLDIGSAMLGIYVNYDGMYTPHKNPVFDYVQKVRREAYAPGGIAFLLMIAPRPVLVVSHAANKSI